MSRYALLAMTVALLCTATTRSQAPAPGQQPTFRSETDLVSVDVLVRVAGDAVGGLTASDFVLRDNGVLQRIESTRSDSGAGRRVARRGRERRRPRSGGAIRDRRPISPTD